MFGICISAHFDRFFPHMRVSLTRVTSCSSAAVPTVQLVVDHVLQPLQPLEDGLPVCQVGNFAISGSQPLLGYPPYLDELLGAVLDPAVDREQDDPHEHQDVDGQQSFDFACHSHEREGGAAGSVEVRASWPARPPSRGVQDVDEEEDGALAEGKVNSWRPGDPFSTADSAQPLSMVELEDLEDSGLLRSLICSRHHCFPATY